MAVKNWFSSDVSKMPAFDTPEQLLDLPPVCFHNLSKNLGGNADPRYDHIVYEVLKKPTKLPACKAEKDCVTFQVRCRLTVPVLAFGDGEDFPPVPPSGKNWPNHKDWNGVTDPCESDLSRALGSPNPTSASAGQLVVEDLVLLFKYGPPRDSKLDPTGFSWRMRGIHAGKFSWYSTTINSKGLVVADGRIEIVGRISGVNSTGTCRTPAHLLPMPANLAAKPKAGAGGCEDCKCGQTCNAPELTGRLYGIVTKFDQKALRGAHVDAVYRMNYDPGIVPAGTEFKVHPLTGKADSCVSKPTTVGRGVLSGVLLRNCDG